MGRSIKEINDLRIERWVDITQARLRLYENPTSPPDVEGMEKWVMIALRLRMCTHNDPAREEFNSLSMVVYRILWAITYFKQVDARNDKRDNKAEDTAGD